MIAKELRLEAFTAEGLQFPLHGRNGRVSKNFFGGEDMSLSFDLDRDPRINYRDVAYGNDVILRRGLNPVFKGEMRSITQGEETLTIGCPGQWIYLDDFNCGRLTIHPARLWCDNRYAMWKPEPGIPGVTWYLSRFAHDQRSRLHLAPRRNEIFGNGPWVVGGFTLDQDSLWVERISFDFDCTLEANWQVYLRSWSAGWVGPVNEWTHATVGAVTGVKDISLVTARPLLAFMLLYNAANARWAGETEDIYLTITNLRLWGDARTESHSSIHVVEKAIEQIQAITPISADTTLALEEMPVRDRFTDANGTALAAHLPDKNELRGAWTIDAGGFDIQTNRANNTAAVSRAVINSGISDGVVCCDTHMMAASPGTYEIGIIFRRVDANNYWTWKYDHGPTVVLRKTVAGVPTVVWSSALGVQHQYNYHLMVKLRGNEIRCYLGGILRTTQYDTDLQTATWHGLFAAQESGMRWDNFEVFQMLPIWPLFYEAGESCYQAVKDGTSFGDWNYRALGWGVEPGGDRAFLRVANRESVRYVIPAQFCRALSARGETQGAFYTSGWASYVNEEGMTRFTALYYVHITNAGLVVNTTATGNDLASTIYGVYRDKLFEYGRVDAGLAAEYVQQTLKEQGHPKVQTSIEVFGPVKDLHRGGALIEPIEMEMGYLVQIPFFRATEAEGVATTDLRDFDTTFLIVGMEVDLETGVAKLIPEGAQEDLSRMIKAARAVVEQDEKRLTSKRSKVVGG